MSEFDFWKITKINGEITLGEWNSIIASSSFLEFIPDRKAINPFTKEEIIFQGEGKAYYLYEGIKSGNISLESGALITTGVPKSFCEELAKSLQAVLQEHEES